MGLEELVGPQHLQEAAQAVAPALLPRIFEGGAQFTYAEMRAATVAFAAGLAGAGVRQGDHVLAWQPSTPEMLITFYAINYLGAVYVPINTAYRGRLLEHVIDNSDAKLAVVHADLAPRLAGVQLARLEKLVLVGGNAGAAPPLPTLQFAELQLTEAALPPLLQPIEPWHTQSIIYTSGTTGPSKGVMSSYLHMYTNPGPESWPFITGADRFLVNTPFFHIGGLGLSFAMLARGGSVVIPERFATERFWPLVREHRVTAIFLLGVMATFLLKAPATDRDRDHAVRKCFIVPLSDGAAEFHERFGADVYTIFNMTEISSPIVSEPNPRVRGTCGKVRAGVQVRLVDGNDCEVAQGSVGEMIVRTDRLAHSAADAPQSGSVAIPPRSSPCSPKSARSDPSGTDSRSSYRTLRCSASRSAKSSAPPDSAPSRPPQKM